MTNEEILKSISKLEEGLKTPVISDSAKECMKAKIEELKSQLTKAEEKVEKKEEKIEKEEKKAQDDLKAVIAKYEEALNREKIPDYVKEGIKKKIAAAKEQLAKAEKEMKEDKKEAETEKKEIKKAVAKVEKIAKSKTPSKAKATPKPKIQEKAREGKAHKRKARLQELTSGLQKLIEKNKFLSEKYKGIGESSLEKDSKRSAKPFGYRFVGEHDYRVPTKSQIKAGLKRGTIDYEARANRSDKYPKAKVKLAKGGEIEREKYITKMLVGKKYPLSNKELKELSEKTGYSQGDIAYVSQKMNDDIQYKVDYMMAKGGKVKVGASQSDKHRFAKPAGWRFKESAEGKTLDGKKITRADLSHSPSKKIRAKYPKYVAFEDRLNKSDVHPTRSSKDSI